MHKTTPKLLKIGSLPNWFTYNLILSSKFWYDYRFLTYRYFAKFQNAGRKLKLFNDLVYYYKSETTIYTAYSSRNRLYSTNLSILYGLYNNIQYSVKSLTYLLTDLVTLIFRIAIYNIVITIVLMLSWKKQPYLVISLSKC